MLSFLAPITVSERTCKHSHTELIEFYQVDLELPNVFSGIAVQGHDREPYWITKFALNYSDDNIYWYQHTNVSGM